MLTLVTMRSLFPIDKYVIGAPLLRLKRFTLLVACQCLVRDIDVCLRLEQETREFLFLVRHLQFRSVLIFQIHRLCIEKKGMRGKLIQHAMKEIEKSFKRTKAPISRKKCARILKYVEASIFKRSAREGRNSNRGWREQ